jgi:hypothetical protein
MPSSAVKPRHVLCFLGKDESLLHPSKAVATRSAYGAVVRGLLGPCLSQCVVCR